MLQYWSGTSSRATRDIDLLASESKTIDALVQLVRECMGTDVPDDGLHFDTESVSGGAIRAPKYAGVRLELIGYLGSARSHIQVDIGFGDVVTPEPVEVEYPMILDFDAPRLLAHIPETTIAEKVEAMVSLGSANTRFKDLYDVWKLSTERTFDCAFLGKALVRNFRRRGTELPRRIETLDAGFANQPQKPAQWTAFLRRAQVEDCPRDLDDLQAALARFLEPLLGDLERGGSEGDTKKVWHPESGWVPR